MDGNWNYSPYMHGLYNGLALAYSNITVRPVEYKDAPNEWLCDQNKWYTAVITYIKSLRIYK